jgi:hypothetical protein
MHQEILGPLHPPPTEISPRRLPKHSPKLPDEVIPREPGSGGHVVEVEGLRVLGIHKIPSPPKMHHPLTPHAPTLAPGPRAEAARRGHRADG